MPLPTRIRTRADGSIDTAHYAGVGRVHRSRAFWSMVRPPRPPRKTGLIVAVLATFGL